jgi:hypothetical protein
VILAFALSGLVSRVDEMPTAVAISAEVAGVVGLAAGVIADSYGRRQRDLSIALSLGIG